MRSGLRQEMSTALVLLLFLVSTTKGQQQQLYPFGPQVGDSQLPTGDDVVELVNLLLPIKFYGQTFDTIFVHTNGLVSFLTEIPKFFNEPFPLEYPIIAALYSNIDTSGGGKVYYRESSTYQDLATITSKLQYLYPSQADFRPESAFIVTWDSVGYYKAKADKVNTFQMVISSDERESFVEIIYPEDGISWIQAESPEGGLPDAKAQAGISFPEREFVKISGSGTDQVFNLPRRNNTSLYPGTFVYRIGNIEDHSKPQPPEIETNFDDEEELVAQSCSDGALLCHKYSDCYDLEGGGICCQCQRGYFGDGVNCLNFEAHRMQGKLNISIGSEEAKDINIQAFIVTGDGRTYTAITGMPKTIGFGMQLLTNIGSFVGFLFAKPIKNAPNGYQLTGGIVNHTMQITINSNDRITINQRFTGVDVYDQLNMEAEIVGSLPYVSKNRLNVLDYQEHFTRVEPGVFRSVSQHEIVVDNSNENFNITVDQIIRFKEHCPSANKNLYSLLFKASRHYLSYEENDSILRFASSNKISHNSDGQNPCNDVSCVANSTCVVNEDTFKCVCNPGFQTLPDQPSDFGCLDINECEDGTATCYTAALCVNEIGTYKCQCPPGYSGDGHFCQRPLSQPKNGYCIEDNGEVLCNCNAGFQGEGDPESEGYCIDIDECESLRPCSPISEECLNTEGSFYCTCKTGFIDTDGVCTPLTNVDTCQSTRCPENSECVETGDGPMCQCKQHYRGTPPYCQIEDQLINICRTDSDCQDNELCTYNDTYNTYLCDCTSGYSRQHNQCVPNANETANYIFKTCVGEKCWCPPEFYDNGDVCVSLSQVSQPTCTEVSCPADSRCTYIATKENYECVCNPGFSSNEHGQCVPFDNSCLQLQSCDVNADCLFNDTMSSYMCVCHDGYIGDGETCYPNEIEENNCADCHWAAICISNTCICPEGMLGDGIFSCEEEIPNCRTLENCDRDAACVYDLLEGGYICKCNEGFEGDGYTCNEIITCDIYPQICSPAATCVFNGSSYNCVCDVSYEGNGTHCSRKESPFGPNNEYIMISKGISIIQYPVEAPSHERGKIIHFYGEQQIIGIAIDCVKEILYWSDITNGKIQSSDYNGSNTETFVATGVKSPEGLVVDWINRVLYWTDSTLRLISYARLDDRIVHNLITTGLVNPRGIAVNPFTRKLYWSDWNRKDPVIESSDLDGQNREVLIDKSNIALPNSLAIDWDTNELCWADAGAKRIGCYNLDNEQIRVVVENCDYPFGLAITSSTYYWSDWSIQKVMRSTKGSLKPTGNLSLVLEERSGIYGLAVTSTCKRY